MWLLGRLLPLIVGQRVPSDDAHWNCYLRLLQILTIATSVEVTKETAPLLSVVTQEYLTVFNSLYPNRIVPKMHYLLVSFTVVS